MSSILLETISQTLSKRPIGAVVSLRAFASGEGVVDQIMGGIWRIAEAIYPGLTGKLSAWRQSNPDLLTLMGQFEQGATFNLTAVSCSDKPQESNDLLLVGQLGLARLEGSILVESHALPAYIKQALETSLLTKGFASFQPGL